MKRLAIGIGFLEATLCLMLPGSTEVGFSSGINPIGTEYTRPVGKGGFPLLGTGLIDPRVLQKPPNVLFDFDTIPRYNGIAAVQSVYVNNGNFEVPSVCGPTYLDTIPGWTTSKEFEIGKSQSYNRNWLTDCQVQELDSNQNDAISQSFTNLKPGQYLIEFQYTAREDYPLQTSQAIVSWDGLQVQVISPNDYDIHSAKIPVKVDSQFQHILTIAGAGASDSVGMTIDNVKLTRTGCGCIRS